MSRSSGTRSTVSRTSARLTRSSDDTITGVPHHGFAPTARVRSKSRIAGRSRTATGRSNRVVSSPAQAPRRAAGARINARSTSPRARSSASTNPAWMVLPRPTASASSTRLTPPRTASAGESCHGSRSTRAPRAVHTLCGGRVCDSASSAPRTTAWRRRLAGSPSEAGSRRSNGSSSVTLRCGFAASAASRMTSAHCARWRASRTCQRSPRACTRAPGTRADRTSCIAVTPRSAQELRGSRALALPPIDHGKDDAR